MPKGVIWAGSSAGSNQLGLSVTCIAYTSSPEGVDCARAFWRGPIVHISIPMSRNIRRFIYISLERDAALSIRPDCLGYITPLHRRKGTVDMVLGSTLAATV